VLVRHEGLREGDEIRAVTSFAASSPSCCARSRYRSADSLPVRVTEEQRYDIATQVVRELKEYGDPWKLDEPVPEPQLAPARPPGAEVK
jgi:hypothetical protein